MQGRPTPRGPSRSGVGHPCLKGRPVCWATTIQSCYCCLERLLHALHLPSCQVRSVLRIDPLWNGKTWRKSWRGCFWHGTHPQQLTGSQWDGKSGDVKSITTQLLGFRMCSSFCCRLGRRIWRSVLIWKHHNLMGKKNHLGIFKPNKLHITSIFHGFTQLLEVRLGYPSIDSCSVSKCLSSRSPITLFLTAASKITPYKLCSELGGDFNLSSKSYVCLFISATHPL